MNREYYQTQYLELAQQVPDDETHLIADLTNLFETDPQEAYEGLIVYLESQKQLEIILRGPLSLEDTIDRIDEKIQHLIHSSSYSHMILDPHILADQFVTLRREIEQGYEGNQDDQLYDMYEKIRDMLG